MSSMLDIYLVFEVLTISSKYRLNRNVFDHNPFFLFFRFVIYEGSTGLEKMNRPKFFDIFS